MVAGTKLSAQRQFDGLIRAAADDKKVKSLDDQLQYLAGKPYKLAPVQRVELRTESNQLDPARQDYALRLNPSNPWEMRHNNLYFKDYKTYLTLEKEIALKESIYERYVVAVDLLYYLRLKRIRQEQARMMETYLNVLEKQQFSESFDDEDYVDLKLDQIELSIDLDEVNLEISNATYQLQLFFPAFQVSETDTAHISVNDAVTIADSVWNHAGSSVIDRYYTNRLSLAAREIKLEKNNINFGFLQAQYQPFRTEQDRYPWNLALGVTLPIFNPNKPDITRRTMDRYEEEQEHVEEVDALSLRKAFLKRQLAHQLAQYQATNEKIKLTKESPLSSVLNTKYNHNPVTQIKFKTNLLKLQTVLAKLEMNLLHTYIELLSSLDALHQQPFINFLSPDLHEVR